MVALQPHFTHIVYTLNLTTILLWYLRFIIRTHPHLLMQPKDLWLNSNNWQTCFLTHIHLQAENYSLNNNCLHSNLHVIMLTKVTMQLASSITC